jgi:hypothetical protein
MASVREVYDSLKSLTNKDQRGFVTPTVFNSFASLAQQSVYNNLFRELEIAENLRNRGADPGRDKSRVKLIKESLAAFSKTSTISKSGESFPLPDDLNAIISAKTSGTVLYSSSTSTTISIIYDEEKMEYILNSTLSSPSEEAPVAIIGEGLEVFPTTIKKIKLRYYKNPEGLSPTTGARTVSTPRFGYTNVNNKEVYSASTSVDFELPEEFVPDLVAEMGKLIGVNLRDQQVYAHSSEETKKL